MIPKQLTLKNFLSYREATLDFRGLHTACICGANGAGKSSLLEAMSWAIWGESRVASEDDIVHMGAAEARVDFVFTLHEQTYRIIRTRVRGQGAMLEFQVAQGTAANFRSLTAKGLRATQHLILAHLKLDYETFVNSAYLRQGRADEFMLKRPGDRKQILADLLKLQRYDELAEQAKEQSRQFKAQVELLERHVTTVQAQLQQGEQIAEQTIALETQIAAMQQAQNAHQETLQTLQATQHQRQTWQHQLALHEQQHRHLSQECQRLQQELAQTEQQRQGLAQLLAEAATIAAGYAQFQARQAEEEVFAAKLQTDQVAQTQRQHYQQQQTQQLHQLQTQVHAGQAQLDAIAQQLADMQSTLSKAPEVETALANLQTARSQLQQLDRRQLQIAPLAKRRHQLQTQIDRADARLTARLEELRAAMDRLDQHPHRHPQLQQALLGVGERIQALEKRQTYQQQVQEKGLERRHFMERLQAHQRELEGQLADMDYQLRQLQANPATASTAATEAVRATAELTLAGGQDEGKPWRTVTEGTVGSTQGIATQSSVAPFTSSLTLTESVPEDALPPCPLCDRPLNHDHWHRVRQKLQAQRQEVLDQIWVIREQLTASEREIQVLRQEYREVDAQLAQLGPLLEERGRLQEQLQVTAQGQTQRTQAQTEIAQLEAALHTGSTLPEIREELKLLNRSLAQLPYDDKDHALARGEVDRWRWAESKQAEIRQTQRRQADLLARQSALLAQQDELAQTLEQHQRTSAAGLADWDQRIAAIGYNLDHHNALRQALRQAQCWQLRQQQLGQAQHQLPQVQQRSAELAQTLATRLQEHETSQAQIQALHRALAATPDAEPQIQAIAAQMAQHRLELDAQLAQLGRLQQQHQQQTTLSSQLAALETELHTARQQSRIYQELAQAFGKNGIPALIIENVLPQLESTTNQILARLSANQLHVQFVTQRAGRTKGMISRTPKLIDTLDILIADAQGTRPYETYSGGEAFRVNFAIRLALARLLAQRSGTALQMLIVDEGFGTQDQEGCDRLIAAINAIAPDFACILTITHMPYFREAFPARIEVTKTQAGSQLALVV
jgi:DNA repair protein SbcC/Rad50